ncbi:hypothetical protein GCM10009816_19050 [Microbacterium aquimaris]
MRHWETGLNETGPRPDGQLGAVIEVMLGTSARIGEVLTLRRCDIDLTSAPTKITAGMIDRAIDAWEAEHSASTIKNSIAPLVRVLDEAVRDDIISINPAKHRARRNLGKHVPHTTGALRRYALPDLSTLQKLATACGKVHQSHSDHVMLAALLAARGSEVAGLRAGDIDWGNRIAWIRR